MNSVLPTDIRIIEWRPIPVDLCAKPGSDPSPAVLSGGFERPAILAQLRSMAAASEPSVTSSSTAAAEIPVELTGKARKKALIAAASMWNLSLDPNQLEQLTQLKDDLFNALPMARFQCSLRAYKYFFYNDGMDIDMMRQAASKMVGEHWFGNLSKPDVSNRPPFPCPILLFFARFSVEDFDRFSCLSSSPVCFQQEESPHSYRFVHSIDIRPSETFGFGSPDQLWELNIVGNAFLYNQIRCMSSILFAVGRREANLAIVDQLLEPDENKRAQYAISSELPLILYDCGYGDTTGLDSLGESHRMDDLWFSSDSTGPSVQRPSNPPDVPSAQTQQQDLLGLYRTLHHRWREQNMTAKLTATMMNHVKLRLARLYPIDASPMMAQSSSSIDGSSVPALVNRVKQQAISTFLPTSQVSVRSALVPESQNLSVTCASLNDRVSISREQLTELQAAPIGEYTRRMFEAPALTQLVIDHCPSQQDTTYSVALNQQIIRNLQDSRPESVEQEDLQLSCSLLHGCQLWPFNRKNLTRPITFSATGSKIIERKK